MIRHVVIVIALLAMWAPPSGLVLDRACEAVHGAVTGVHLAATLAVGVDDSSDALDDTDRGGAPPWFFGCALGRGAAPGTSVLTLPLLHALHPRERWDERADIRQNRPSMRRGRGEPGRSS